MKISLSDVRCEKCGGPTEVPMISIDTSPPNVSCTLCGYSFEFFNEETWPGYWIPYLYPLREWRFYK